MGLEINILAVHLKRSHMYSHSRLTGPRLLRLWGGGLGRVRVEKKYLTLQEKS